MNTLPFFGGVDVMRATFVNHSFSKHFHEGYALGCITDGAMEFRYLGQTHVAPAGKINLVVPGEVHDGHAAVSAGWSYAMFYLKPQALQEAARAVGAPNALPHFRMGVIDDPALAACVRQTHEALQDKTTGSLEKETRLYWLLAQWISRHAEETGNPARAGNEHRAVARVRDLLHDRLDEDITLDELAGTAALSPFHLLRVFRKRMGITPHAYLTQERVNRARAMLSTSARLADIAQDCGFSDQAHLTRLFKRQLGITPGRYRNILQNS